MQQDCVGSHHSCPLQVDQSLQFDVISKLPTMSEIFPKGTGAFHQINMALIAGTLNPQDSLDSLIGSEWAVCHPLQKHQKQRERPSILLSYRSSHRMVMHFMLGPAADEKPHKARAKLCRFHAAPQAAAHNVSSSAVMHVLLEPCSLAECVSTSVLDAAGSSPLLWIHEAGGAICKRVAARCGLAVAGRNRAGDLSGPPAASGPLSPTHLCLRADGRRRAGHDHTP